MARYSQIGTQTNVTSPTDSTLTLTAETVNGLRRGRLVEVTFSAPGTPADNALIHAVQRCTTQGTGGSVTPTPNDTADVACLTVATDELTAEPTYTAGEVMHKVGVNQRTTYRWLAGQGGEIIWPATDEYGLGFYTEHASYTGIALASVQFDEL
jgi:ABC-type phosphate transport system substrate-binding protein